MRRIEWPRTSVELNLAFMPTNPQLEKSSESHCPSSASRTWFIGIPSTLYMIRPFFSPFFYFVLSLQFDDGSLTEWAPLMFLRAPFLPANGEDIDRLGTWRTNKKRRREEGEGAKERDIHL